MTKKYCFLLLFLSISLWMLAQEKSIPISIESTPFSIGETQVFHSNILKEDRTINVYLPVSYLKNKETNCKYEDGFRFPSSLK